MNSPRHIPLPEPAPANKIRRLCRAGGWIWGALRWNLAWLTPVFDGLLIGLALGWMFLYLS